MISNGGRSTNEPVFKCLWSLTKKTQLTATHNRKIVWSRVDNQQANDKFCTIVESNLGLFVADLGRRDLGLKQRWKCVCSGCDSAWMNGALF
jgi:hypothetical protein